MLEAHRSSKQTHPPRKFTSLLKQSLTYPRMFFVFVYNILNFLIQKPVNHLGSVFGVLDHKHGHKRPIPRHRGPTGHMPVNGLHGGYTNATLGKMQQFSGLEKAEESCTHTKYEA